MEGLICQWQHSVPPCCSTALQREKLSRPVLELLQIFGIKLYLFDPRPHTGNSVCGNGKVSSLLWQDFNKNQVLSTSGASWCAPLP